MEKEKKKTDQQKVNNTNDIDKKETHLAITLLPQAHQKPFRMFILPCFSPTQNQERGSG
jgi:hypothetical protein